MIVETAKGDCHLSFKQDPLSWGAGSNPVTITMAGSYNIQSIPEDPSSGGVGENPSPAATWGYSSIWESA